MEIRWLLALLFFPLAAAACDYPDEGTLPLHRAVTKVKPFPHTAAWAPEPHKSGTVCAIGAKGVAVAPPGAASAIASAGPRRFTTRAAGNISRLKPIQKTGIR